MNNRKFEKIMRNFLIDIEKQNSIDYSNETIRRCVYECSKREYVSGFQNIGFSARGNIVFEIPQNPQITKSGYEFIDKHPNWIAITTMITSAITAIGVLIQLILQIA